MSDLIIYGWSDDLVEVEGVVSDEFTHPFNKPAIVTIKVDGTAWARVHTEYDPDDSGEWRVRPVVVPAPLTLVAARGDGEPDDEHGCPGYSDKVVIDMGSIEASRISVSVKRAK